MSGGAAWGSLGAKRINEQQGGMTALSKYQHLEARAIWRASPDAQRREVMVSLGEASLIITAMSDRALSHWSLPAVMRINPGQSPALYAPDASADETLEIADPDMVGAIETLRHAIEQARPHPGRLRYVLTGLAVCALGALAVLWLPGALMRQTASVLPEAKRVDLGQALISEMAMLSGSPCGDAVGRQALGQLAARVLGPDAPSLVVLPQVLAGTARLPGDILILDRGLIENHETPEVLAGYLLAEMVGYGTQDAALTLLQDAGLGPTFQLLTTGDIQREALHRHATALLTDAKAQAPSDALLAAFAEAEISSQPYAYALDITGEETLALIEGDLMRGRVAAPLMSDQSWVALQGICGG